MQSLSQHDPGSNDDCMIWGGGLPICYELAHTRWPINISSRGGGLGEFGSRVRSPQWYSAALDPTMSNTTGTLCCLDCLAQRLRWTDPGRGLIPQFFWCEFRSEPTSCQVDDIEPGCILELFL